MLYVVIIFGVIILDRITKALILNAFDAGESMALVDSVFHLTYVQNTGAAFSVLRDRQIFLIIFGIILMLALAVFLFINRRKLGTWLGVGLSLLLGGGLGNLIDRIIYGYVVDFLDFRIWPVFNVADIAVVVGCAVVVISVFKDKKPEKGGNV